MPVEFAARYRQQFIDRLWMRGLWVTILIYGLGVLIYFVFLEVAKKQQRKLEDQIASLNSSYTNSLQLKVRIQILQDQLDLRYAALDSWKAVIEALPADLTLNRIVFQKGQKVMLSGTGPGDQVSKVTDYNEALNKAVANDKKLFSKVTPQNSSLQNGPGGVMQTVWNIECELQRSELK